MRRLRNIAYNQESVTTGQTHRRTDGQTDIDRQTPDKVIPMLCFAVDTKMAQTPIPICALRYLQLALQTVLHLQQI